MRYRKSAHAIYKTEYHPVWIPRYRGVKEYTAKTLAHIPDLDLEVIKLSVQIDHVYMVIVIPPRIAVADVVQNIKSQSAKSLRRKILFFTKHTQAEKVSGHESTVYRVSG